MVKVAAIIQARLGSTRLPGKTLMKIGDRSVLEMVVDRVKKAKTVDKVIVATTIEEEDQEIEKICSESETDVFRGSVEDVLDRYYKAAKQSNAENIIRITADCPFIDPDIIDLAVNTHLEGGYDYTSNTIVESYPDGLDVEVITFVSLEKCWEKAKLLSEREHVTAFIKNNKDEFSVKSIENNENLSKKRWTLDEYVDYEFIISVYNGLVNSNPDFRMKDIIEFLKNNPDLENINNHIMRNEGYAKSLREDGIINRGESNE